MGGFTGEGAKTVIPSKATAKVSLRLVPGLTRDGVQAALEKAARKLAPKWADVEVRALHGGDPVQVDVTAPAFEALDQAFEEVIGARTVSVRAGGSIPVVPARTDGAPGAHRPASTTAHSPNEKVNIQQIWDGIRSSVASRFCPSRAREGAGTSGA
jgi:acetylornithine deacetylase/succinyl-diaminopimelate desuccinylase-like protein